MTGMKIGAVAMAFPLSLATLDLTTAWREGGMVVFCIAIIGVVWGYAIRKDGEYRRAIDERMKGMEEGYRALMTIAQSSVAQNERGNILAERVARAIEDNTRVLEHCRDAGRRGN